MNPRDVQAALPVLGLVGSMGLFLPSLDKAWAVDPHEPTLYGKQLRRGQSLYLGMAFSLCLLASYGAGTTLPLLIGGGFAIAVVMTYERAYRHDPGDVAPPAE